MELSVFVTGARHSQFSFQVSILWETENRACDLCVFVTGAKHSQFSFQVSILWETENLACDLVAHIKCSDQTQFYPDVRTGSNQKFQCFMKEISYKITLLTCKIQQRKVKFSSWRQHQCTVPRAHPASSALLVLASYSESHMHSVKLYINEIWHMILWQQNFIDAEFI